MRDRTRNVIVGLTMLGALGVCMYGIVLLGKFFDESCVGIAGASAELMIEMADNEFFVTGLDQPM